MEKKQPMTTPVPRERASISSWAQVWFVALPASSDPDRQRAIHLDTHLRAPSSLGEFPG